jgi:hypothetical protein
MLEKFVHAGVTQSCNLIELFAGGPTRIAEGPCELAAEISSGLVGEHGPYVCGAAAIA